MEIDWNQPFLFLKKQEKKKKISVLPTLLSSSVFVMFDLSVLRGAGSWTSHATCPGLSFSTCKPEGRRIQAAFLPCPFGCPQAGARNGLIV